MGGESSARNSPGFFCGLLKCQAKSGPKGIPKGAKKKTTLATKVLVQIHVESNNHLTAVIVPSDHLCRFVCEAGTKSAPVPKAEMPQVPGGHQPKVAQLAPQWRKHMHTPIFPLLIV